MPTYAHHERAGWPRVRPWLAALGALLVLAAAVGVGVLIGRSTKSVQPVHGLATEDAVTAIDDSTAALNRGDFAVFGPTFAKDAVYEEPQLNEAGMIKGREEIVQVVKMYQGFGARYYRVGPMIQQGNLVAFAVSCPRCPGEWRGIDVARFDRNWRIDHYWTGLSAGPAPPPSR